MQFDVKVLGTLDAKANGVSFTPSVGLSLQPVKVLHWSSYEILSVYVRLRQR